MDKLFIPLILGTNRKDRISKRVAEFIISELSKQNNLKTELIDTANFKLPQEGYGPDLIKSFPKYKKTIKKADGLIIVAPEYNHSYPGRLKSVLDLLYQEYNHKAVGIIGVSAGIWGGTRVIESLIPILKAFGLAISKFDLQFPQAQDLLTADGIITDDSYTKRTNAFIIELVWLAKTLKWGRENIK